MLSVVSRTAPSPRKDDRTFSMVSFGGSTSAVSSSASSMHSWTRPPSVSYSIKALKNIPHRLLHPPPAGVPRQKSGLFYLTPSYDVKLDDMLSGRYLSPIGLKDFAGWLTFTEMSEENLHFIQWLKQYTAQYRRCMMNHKPPLDGLAQSALEAINTFFSPNGSYELNLPSHVRREVTVLKDTISPSTNGPASVLDPAIFATAEAHVSDMLNASLIQFVRQMSANADLSRRCYSTLGGVSLIVNGLVPVLVSILLPTTRYIRLVAFPFFWLGALIALAGYARVCIIIYTWGDFRQLHGYELGMPVEKAGNGYNHPYSGTSPPGYPPTSPNYLPADKSNSTDRITISSALGGTMVDDDEDLEAQDCAYSAPPPFNLGKTPRGVESQQRQEQEHESVPEHGPVVGDQKHTGLNFKVESISHPDAPNQGAAGGKEVILSGDGVARSPSLASKSSRTSRRTPMFGPVTRVASPLVVRAQWEIIIQSAIWGFVFAVTLQLIVLVLPARGHGWGEGW